LWDVCVDVMDAVLDNPGDWESFSGLSTLKAMRIVRLTRILKTAQFLRIFRFIMALRMLVQSILGTLKALFWALLLLVLIIYVFAVLFALAISDLVEGTDPVPDHIIAASHQYFGGLGTSMLSLFMSIAGGVSWEEVLAPLTHISPVWSMCFVFFISFTNFAVLNVVTAVFLSSSYRERTVGPRNCGPELAGEQRSPPCKAASLVQRARGSTSWWDDVSCLPREDSVPRSSQLL